MDKVKARVAGSDSAVLFPEYVARAVRHGIEESDILPRIEYLCVLTLIACDGALNF